jgi:transposase InsO family protein
VFGYSKQAYYKACGVHAHEELKECVILELVQEYRSELGRLGGRKLHHLIRARLPDDLRMGRDQFFRLLGAHGYLLRNRRVRVRTTNSYHHYHRFPNLIRDFIPDDPCRLYVSDITYLSGKDGEFYYLCLVTDAYSRKIMGWSVWDTLAMSGPLEALRMALSQTPPTAKLIHHSDRGVQYCGHDYVRMLRNAPLAEVNISMTESGDPLENAMAERVNGILKTEWLNRMELTSLEDARRKVEKVVRLYNTKRPHASIDMLTPEQAHQMSGPIKRRWKKRKKIVYTRVCKSPTPGSTIHSRPGLETLYTRV